MIPRQWMLDTIRRVFERFGFLPLDTPSIERREVLTGGDPEFSKQIYDATLRGKTPGELALRFDLTVSLARIVALYPNRIVKPFKRYQMGTVYRGEKPQAGRFNEFTQFDADIIGSDRVGADAEIVSVMYETLMALGVMNFRIKVNNRRVLNGLADYVGYPSELTPEVLRLIDKLDKIGWNDLASELAINASLSPAQLEKLKVFLDLRADSNEGITAAVIRLMPNSSEAVRGATELAEITKIVDALGVPREAWEIDLSVARGLGYYTGPVFETSLINLPKIGSVFSGGRYDDLVARFGKDSIPATGASVGVDRLFVALKTLGLLPEKKSTTKVVVLNFDQSAEGYCNHLVATLRRSDISSELYLGKEKTLGAQLNYALRQEVPVVIIAGGRERDGEVVQIKFLAEKRQVVVPLKDLIDTVKGFVT